MPLDANYSDAKAAPVVAPATIVGAAVRGGLRNDVQMLSVALGVVDDATAKSASLTALVRRVSEALCVTRDDGGPLLALVSKLKSEALPALQNRMQKIAKELDLVEPSGPASFPRLVAAAHEKLGLKQELSVALCKQVSRLADAVGGEL